MVCARNTGPVWSARGSSGDAPSALASRTEVGGLIVLCGSFSRLTPEHSTAHACRRHSDRVPWSCHNPARTCAVSPGLGVKFAPVPLAPQGVTWPSLFLTSVVPLAFGHQRLCFATQAAHSQGLAPPRNRLRAAPMKLVPPAHGRGWVPTSARPLWPPYLRAPSR